DVQYVAAVFEALANCLGSHIVQNGIFLVDVDDVIRCLARFAVTGASNRAEQAVKHRAMILLLRCLARICEQTRAHELNLRVNWAVAEPLLRLLKKRLFVTVVQLQEGFTGCVVDPARAEALRILLPKLHVLFCRRALINLRLSGANAGDRDENEKKGYTNHDASVLTRTR